MEFIRLGQINPNKEYSINPVKYLDNSRFKRLNFLLDFIAKEIPQAFQGYIKQLKIIFENLIKEKKNITDYSRYKEIIDQYPQLVNQSELIQLYINYLTEKINLPIEETTITSDLKIPSKIFWQLGFGILYYEALALTKIIEREAAIKLFKKYLDQYYVFVEETFTKYKSLDELRNEHLKDAQKSTDAEFLTTYSSVENGRYIIRNENCPAIEALEDCEDRELIYLVCCYPDYQYALMTNENFRMTRYYTIAEKDPYCDKVIHDIRISKNLEHPTTDFLDGMGSLSKEHWRKDYFKKK